MAMTTKVKSDVAYCEDGVTDKQRQFDIYFPAAYSGGHHQRPLLCFVHGGAWRSEDKSQHAELAKRLVERTGCVVAVPNYRLTSPSTPHRHPTHAHDLQTFLHFLLSPQSPHPPSSLVLIGHSCSAHMIASIFLSPANPDPNPDPSLVLQPSHDLLALTRGFVLSEGIYDIDCLIASFPSYTDWFIANTFGSLDSYAQFNVATYSLRPDSEHLRWLILHAPHDPLVDTIQSETFYSHLLRLYNPPDALPHPSVSLDTQHLKSPGHNDIFEEDAYLDLIQQFVHQFTDSQ